MNKIGLIEDILIDASEEFYELRNKEAIKKIGEAWEIIPNPKIEHSYFWHFISHALNLCRGTKMFLLGNQLVSLYFNYTDITEQYYVDSEGDMAVDIGNFAYVEGNLEVAKYVYWIADYISEKLALSDSSHRLDRRLAEGKTKIDFDSTLRGRTYKTIEILGKDKEVLSDFENVLNQWDELAEPKLLQDESYTIAKAFIKLCIENELYELGNSSISLLFIAGINVADQGERAFIAGELAYAQGLLEIAKQNFYAANRKSKGSCFNEQNHQYLELLDNDKLEFKLNDEKPLLKVPKKEEPRKLSRKEYKEIMKLYKEADKLPPEKGVEKFEEILNKVPMCEENDQIINLLYAAIGDKQIELNQYKEGLDSFYSIYNTGVVTNPYVLIKLGICYYELGNMPQATEFFMRTYMLDEKELFNMNDEKYFDLIKDIVE